MASNDVDLDQIIATIESAQAGAEPLDRVAAAREVAARLEAFSQHVVAHFVDEARQGGASWTDIGAALGVTRQAAQQRFVPAEGVDVDAATNRSAPPYSTRASATLGAARDLAQEHHHPAVEDIHLLLALLDNRSGGAIGIVKAAGQRTADVRKSARAELGADGPRRSTKNPPLGRGAAKALDVATRETLRLGAVEVGTEQLLLALTSDASSPAGRTLADAGLPYPHVRREVTKQVSANEGRRPAQKRSRRKRS